VLMMVERAGGINSEGMIGGFILVFLEGRQLG
jgi:hypothetical protein